MRGGDTQQEVLFSYLFPEYWISKNHPLGPVRDLVNTGLVQLAPDFEALYVLEGRPSMKSVRRLDGSDDPPPGGGRNSAWDFHGEQRTNETHESTTDPEAQIFRKGPVKETRLC